MAPPAIHRYLVYLVVAAFLPPFGLAVFLLVLDAQAHGLFNQWSNVAITAMLGVMLVLPGLSLSAWLGVKLARASDRLARAAQGLGTREYDALSDQPMPCLEFELLADCLRSANENVTARDDAQKSERDIFTSQQRELERSNAELEQFAYVASHDLREPIRMVTSFLGLLERRLNTRLDKECREFLDFARDGARRMDRMVLDLLDYSRAGRHEADQTPVDCNSALAEAVQRLSSLIADSNARIEAATTLPTISGHFDEIVRLFQNLIANACKYRHPDRPPVIRVTAEPLAEHNHFALHFEDNCIGVAPQDCERVFQIFQRLHGAEIEGNGIGLAVCKKIVEHHCGTISATGRLGEGTILDITLGGPTCRQAYRAAE